MACAGAGLDKFGKLYNRRGAEETKSKYRRREPVYELRRYLYRNIEKNALPSEGLDPEFEGIRATHSDEFDPVSMELDAQCHTFDKLTLSPSMKFIGVDRLVLTEENTVVIYDLTKSKRVHNIRLTHPISSIDVWKYYLLIGSSVVHVVDTREEHWRRILVVNMDEKESLKNPSQHLAAFNTNGEFATASTRSNTVVLWPQPVESGGLMTTKKSNYSCSQEVESISSLFIPACCESFIAVLGKAVNSDMIVDIIDWGSGTLLKSIKLAITMDPSVLALSSDGKYLAVKQDNKYMVEYDLVSEATDTQCIIETESNISSAIYLPSSQNILVGLNNGAVKMRDQTMIKRKSAVTSFALCDDAVWAIGLQDGSIYIEKEDLDEGMRSTQISSSFSELDSLSVFMPGSFLQQHLLCDVCDFEVDWKGGVFTNRHSYSLTIPEGAIQQGELVKIKTGVMAYGPYGPFKYPKDSTAVSPIVWFASEPEVQFRKPAVLKLQHCSTDSQRIGILKGGHNAISKSFQLEEINVKKDIEEDGYVALSVNHFCIYCLSVYTEENVENARFCIIPIEGWNGQEKEVIFCIAYDLDTCRKAVREQYEYKGSHFVVQDVILISFSGSSTIKVEYDVRNSSMWRVALKSGSNQISMSQMKYRERFSTSDEMVVAHKDRTYPPRFKYQIVPGGEKNEKVKFIFRGLKESKEYEVSLAAPVADIEREQGNKQPKDDDGAKSKWNPNDVPHQQDL